MPPSTTKSYRLNFQAKMCPIYRKGATGCEFEFIFQSPASEKDKGGLRTP